MQSPMEELRDELGQGRKSNDLIVGELKLTE
jgi:hypothetical protein